MVAYLRRHHIGLLALFIALGGTSYAAAKLPRNSVGTTQIKSGAVTEAKLAQAVRDQLGRTVQGSPGAAGAQGPKGDTGPAGAAGPKGDTGGGHGRAGGREGRHRPHRRHGGEGRYRRDRAAGRQGRHRRDRADGAERPHGPHRPQGDKGEQGKDGKDGAQGPQGIPGPTSAGIGGTNINITPAAGTADPRGHERHAHAARQGARVHHGDVLRALHVGRRLRPHDRRAASAARRSRAPSRRSAATRA